MSFQECFMLIRTSFDDAEQYVAGWLVPSVCGMVSSFVSVDAGSTHTRDVLHAACTTPAGISFCAGVAQSCMRALGSASAAGVPQRHSLQQRGHGAIRDVHHSCHVRDAAAGSRGRRGAPHRAAGPPRPHPSAARERIPAWRCVRHDAHAAGAHLGHPGGGLQTAAA